MGRRLFEEKKKLQLSLDRSTHEKDRPVMSEVSISDHYATVEIKTHASSYFLRTEFIKTRAASKLNAGVTMNLAIRQSIENKNSRWIMGSHQELEK